MSVLTISRGSSLNPGADADAQKDSDLIEAFSAEPVSPIKEVERLLVHS